MRVFHQRLAAVKFIVDNLLLITIALASGALLIWPIIKGGTRAGSVGTAEAVRLINREKGILIDVSEPAEYAAGHAAGSRNLPLASLEGSKALPANKALPLIVICPSGSRAGRAAATLRKLGFEKATALAGGTAAWREASLPIEKSAA
jgi:rhodanese-related sulfurtransferase